MELKRRVRQAIELAVFVSALPVLLLGCGGGGGATSSDPNAGMMSGQFWTDFTGGGIKRLYPGHLATASSVAYPALAITDTAAFVPGGGRYALTRDMVAMSGVAWAPRPANSYYLASGGWQAVPSTFSFTALNATTLRFAELAYSTATISVSSVNLAGMTVTATSAVPAIDSLANASSVLPASTTYPAGSYLYTLNYSDYTRETEYWVWSDPLNEVTTYASSVLPAVTAATFNDAAFKAHNTVSDPICVGWAAFVYSGTGNTYNVYGMTLNGGVPSGTPANCENATIPVGPAALGTYDLTFSTILGTTVATFSSPTGWFATHDSHGNYVLGAPILGGKVYFGDIFPAGTTTSSSTWLNKTAMDTALGAWGAPTF